MVNILISAAVLGLAFTIATRGNATTFLFSLLTVGVGFIGHELAHKFMAMRFGYYAAYQIWPLGLLMALILSMGGFIFAALGAVQIFARGSLFGRRISLAEQGIISLAGPTFNIVLAVAFMGLAGIYGDALYGELFAMGAYINSLIALFNCLPVFILDGRKIFAWDKMMWAVAIGASGLMLALNL
jgi:Zn-dependent protease